MQNRIARELATILREGRDIGRLSNDYAGVERDSTLEVIYRKIHEQLPVATTPFRYHAILNILQVYCKNEFTALLDQDITPIVEEFTDNPTLNIQGRFTDNDRACLELLNTTKIIEGRLAGPGFATCTALSAWAAEECRDRALLQLFTRYQLDANSELAQELQASLDGIYLRGDHLGLVEQSNFALQKTCVILELLKQGVGDYQYAANLAQRFLESTLQIIRGRDQQLSEYDQSPRSAAKPEKSQCYANAQQLIYENARKVANHIQAKYPLTTESSLIQALNNSYVLAGCHTGERVKERVIDEIIAMLHERIAEEVEILTGIDRVTMVGDEHLFRGMKLALNYTSGFHKEEIYNLFRLFHRSIRINRNGQREFASHEITTTHNYGLGRNTIATSTTANLRIASEYSRGTGCILELRPKAGQTAIAYCQYGAYGADANEEIVWSQTNPRDLYAVHIIRNREVIETIHNPYYEKRPTDGLTPQDFEYLRLGNYISFTPNYISPAYQHHIQNKPSAILEETLPRTKEAVKARRMARGYQTYKFQLAEFRNTHNVPAQPIVDDSVQAPIPFDVGLQSSLPPPQPQLIGVPVGRPRRNRSSRVHAPMSRPYFNVQSIPSIEQSRSSRSGLTGAIIGGLFFIGLLATAISIVLSAPTSATAIFLTNLVNVMDDGLMFAGAALFFGFVGLGYSIEKKCCGSSESLSREVTVSAQLKSLFHDQALISNLDKSSLSQTIITPANEGKQSEKMLLPSIGVFSCLNKHETNAVQTHDANSSPRYRGF